MILCGHLWGKNSRFSANVSCEYDVIFIHGSLTTGFSITDPLQFDQVNTDRQTQSGNVTITFEWVKSYQYIAV
jgi:hypothetical protein